MLLGAVSQHGLPPEGRPKNPKKMSLLFVRINTTSEFQTHTYTKIARILDTHQMGQVPGPEDMERKYKIIPRNYPGNIHTFPNIRY